MARRGRKSVFEDLIDIAATLPYWISLILAVVSYFVLHHFAATPVQVATRPGSAVPLNMGELLFHPLLSVMQYAVPMIFAFGATISVFKAFIGHKLADEYVATQPIETPAQDTARNSKPTDDLSWQQFELLVGQAFRQAGYRVIDGGEEGADGGVDVYLKKDDQRFFVQCKHWKTRNVGVSVVRELYGVIAGAGAKGGFIVTSGDFTGEAKAFASDKRIGLINGQKLDKMLRGAAKSLPEEVLRPSHVAIEIPSCPKCSSVMVKRRARQGAHAGQEFWGCSRYPKCRGIRST